MTPFPWTDVVVIVGLVVLNAMFAMSELAIVSARPARLKLAAERGSGGAAVALRLASDPGRFLSTVQSGITLIGVVAGAFSGTHLGQPIGERLVWLGVPARWADDAGFAIAIVGTTYINLVIGELVPKQIALRVAEPIAIHSARPMAIFARVTAPLVWVLDRSSRLFLRLLGVKAASEPEVTEEELHMMFAEAEKSGVIEEDEREIMAGIMRLADRPVREVMTPRTEVDWIDCDDCEDDVRAAILASPHSRLPVMQGSPDNVIGVVSVREVQAALLAGEPLALGRLIRKAEIVPDQIDAMDALGILQRSGVSMALVHDEYGHLEGIVTPADLLSAIVGNFVSHGDDGDEPMIVVRDDGSLLVSGALPADELGRRLKISLPDNRDYATAAGFALSILRHLPREGECFEEQGWKFEIVDMDGRKIDKLLVTRLEEDDPVSGD